MYEIWAADLLIHSDITPLETVKAINPRLNLEDSAAGSLEFSLPPINVGYSQDVLKRMVTDITVKCDGEWLWSGRILQDDFDFWNNRKIVCEGELAFLNDSIQPPHKYLSTDTTIQTFLTSLITNHNSQVGENRRFEVGMVTVNDGDQQEDNDAIYRFTNYETTLACINEKLVNKLKGHVRVRHDEGKRYIDYISDESLSTNSQVVRFGVNLLDFTKNVDMSELSTVIVPRGERLEIDSSDSRYIEGLEPYLTVESLGQKTEHNDTTGEDEVWHDASSMFVKNPTAIDNFGWVCTVVDWSNVTDANTLYSKAVKYLKDEQYEKVKLEIQALDLKYLSDSNEPIKFLSKLRCISEPHNMDHTFIVSKMELDLTNPANSLYTLGSDVKQSLTQATNRVNQSVKEEMERIPSKSEILVAAEKSAYHVIMGQDGSYVHLIPGDDGTGIKRIEVTDGPTYIQSYDLDDDPATDPFPDSLNRWIWTAGGLGHIGRDTYQEEWAAIGSMNVALQKTGEIVADMITVGILKAINNYYQLNTQTGYVQMEYGKFGPWYLNYGGEGFTNNSNAWLGPNKISCGQHGGTYIAMNGRSSGHDGYLTVTAGNDSSDYIHVEWNSIERKDNGGESYAKFESGSDEKIKEDIQYLSLEEALSIIENTDPLTFRYKTHTEKIKHYGVTAQRMEKECEELGIENPFVKNLKGDLKTVDYDQFIAPLIKVVQDQQRQIEDLKRSLQNE